MLSLIALFTVALSFPLFTARQSTRHDTITSIPTPVLRANVQAEKKKADNHISSFPSSLVVCEMGCSLCSDENASVVECFLEMNSPVTVLRVVEVEFGFLKVVSRVDIGTDLLEVDGINPTDFNLSSSCPNPFNYTLPLETMAFCLRKRSDDVLVAARPPSPPAIGNLPQGILGPDFRQVERLSTPSRVEASQLLGVTILTPVSLQMIQQEEQPISDAGLAGNAFEARGAARVGCTTRVNP